MTGSLVDLVVCPWCLATLTKPCTSSGGRWVPDHPVRLVSRRCPCGNLPRAGSRFCTNECRLDARARTYQLREQRTPTRARRRAVVSTG